MLPIEGPDFSLKKVSFQYSTIIRLVHYKLFTGYWGINHSSYECKFIKVHKMNKFTPMFNTCVIAFSFKALTPRSVYIFHCIGYWYELPTRRTSIYTSTVSRDQHAIIMTTMHQLWQLWNVETGGGMVSFEMPPSNICIHMISLLLKQISSGNITPQFLAVIWCMARVVSLFITQM